MSNSWKKSKGRDDINMEFLLLKITKLEKLQEKEQIFQLFPSFWI